MTSRRTRSLAAGLAVVACYAGSAWLSGQLSPLARRPLLDGLAPPTPYRWVDPPAELASTNLEPAFGTFRVQLGNRGSLTAVLTTDDAQVTLILPKGSFAPAERERAVEVKVRPLAVSAIDPPPSPLEVLGNVYRVNASYVPSGERADLAAKARVVLSYPFSTGTHPGTTIVHSTDGATWTRVDTNDLPSIQQADAPIDALGDVAVARDTTVTTSPAPGGDEGSSVATIAIVIGLVVLAVAAAVTLRGSSRGRGGGNRPGAPSRPARGAARGSRPSRSRNSRRD